MSRALIEQWLPAPAISAESLRERGSAKALPPLNFLHVWWARRPLMTSRAAVVASLLPAWPAAADMAVDPRAASVLAGLRTEFPGGESEYRAWFLEALGVRGDPVAARRAIQAAKANGTRTIGNAYGHDRAFTVSPDDKTLDRIHRLASLRADVGDRISLLDPFAGGGSIPFEAERFGCDTIANELNPVATAILAGTVELPAKLGGEFSATIARYGNLSADRVRRRLHPFFPIQRPDELLAYIWAHTVPCLSTGRPTPLAPDMWLARGAAGREVAVAMEVDREAGTYELLVVEGNLAAHWGDRTTYKRGVATSIWTGETFSGEYIQHQATAGNLGQMLLAVSVTRPGHKGREFRAPSAEDLAAVAAASSELERRRPGWEVVDLIPTESIPEGNDLRPLHMGLAKWCDLFTPRQLLANVTALECLGEAVAEARGTLSEEQTRALALYLGFALDKAVDYNGRLSSWHSSRMLIRNTFDRHDFSFKWTFAEFDTAHALIPWAVKNAVMNHEKISALVTEHPKLSGGTQPRVRVIRGSATDLPLPDGSVDVIVTDPPYYDNVMYAECSDYFYVWLKRSLASTWPELCTLDLTDKANEAVANPALFKELAGPTQRGKRKDPTKLSATDLAEARYEELLTASFREAYRVLADDGVMTVMFTHKRTEAWDILGSALLGAGFSITSSWPVETESEHSLHQAKKNAASSTIFLACRKRVSVGDGYWADIRAEVEATAERSALAMAADGLTGVDLTIATFGPVLAVLSRCWPVYTGELDSEGNPEILRPDKALDLARERVARLKMRGLLGGKDIEFDRVTDWYLLAWNDFRAEEFPYDEARKLSIATHLELDDLAKRHKVLRQGSGKVTILTPAQRRTAGALDPEAASFATWLDRLHALMLVYDEEGLGAARSWLGRNDLAEDAKLAELVGAAMRAIPRVKDKGAFARPEARILDSLRSALFEHVEPPAGAGPAAVQGLLSGWEEPGTLGVLVPGELAPESPPHR